MRRALRRPVRRVATLIARLTTDVDASTGLVVGAHGLRVGAAAGSKGLGVFATSPLAGGTVIGSYVGEHLTAEALHMRYGTDAANWHCANVHSRPWV